METHFEEHDLDLNSTIHWTAFWRAWPQSKQYNTSDRIWKCMSLKENSLACTTVRRPLFQVCSLEMDSPIPKLFEGFLGLDEDRTGARKGRRWGGKWGAGQWWNWTVVNKSTLSINFSVFERRVDRTRTISGSLIPSLWGSRWRVGSKY
jgi:hypothetical protein